MRKMISCSQQQAGRKVDALARTPRPGSPPIPQPVSPKQEIMLFSTQAQALSFPIEPNIKRRVRNGQRTFINIFRKTWRTKMACHTQRAKESVLAHPRDGRKHEQE